MESAVRARKSAADDVKRMRIVKWAVAGFGGGTVLLLLAMQQDRQRRVAIGAILVVGLGIEGAFQVEERRFRADVREIGEAVKAAGSGSVPKKEELVKAGVKAVAKENVSYQVDRDGKG